MVNCGDNFEKQVEAGAYACPIEGAASVFENNEYFGMYWNLAVRRVARLRGVIDLNPQTGLANLVWNNERASGLTAADLIDQAREKLPIMFPAKQDVQRVFLLTELQETNFQKPTPRGIQYRKKYFDVRCLRPTSAADLARKLNGKTWDNYCK